jgi:hypothetical protein
VEKSSTRNTDTVKGMDMATGSDAFGITSLGDRASGNNYCRRIRELIKKILQAAADRRDLE